MRSLSLVFLLAIATGSQAQYFSQGWQPGQPAAPSREEAAAPASGSSGDIWEAGAGEPDTADTAAAPLPPAAYQETEEWTEWTPPVANSKSEEKGKEEKKTGVAGLFSGGINGVLTSDMSVDFFNKLGINITDKLGSLDFSLWDERVQLITDDNFDELIVNEEMDEEEAKERVWAVVVSASAAKQGGVPKFVDDAFDASYNATLIANDLLHVRWGRIDYLNVTYLTTKWSLWRAPMIMFISDRGQTLRFVGPNEIRLRNEGLREALLTDVWKYKQPWKSSFSPGGSNEYIMDFFALWMTKAYNMTVIIPKWLLYILSGSVASFVLSFLHKGDPAPQPKPKPVEEEKAAPVAPAPAKASTSAVASPSSKSAKKRKVSTK